MIAMSCELTPVRILDILLWTEVEPRGYYRTSSSVASRGADGTTTR
jgi:hypothetical protein